MKWLVLLITSLSFQMDVAPYGCGGCGSSGGGREYRDSPPVIHQSTTEDHNKTEMKKSKKKSEKIREMPVKEGE